MDQLATCSALTASASRAQHFNALDQLRKVLGVEVFDTIGEFAEWMRPGSVVQVLKNRSKGYAPEMTFSGDPVEIGEGEYVVVHCMGGLGRTGTIAACTLVDRGANARDAISLVREGRGPRAVESESQARFVADYQTIQEVR